MHTTNFNEKQKVKFNEIKLRKHFKNIKIELTY